MVHVTGVGKRCVLPDEFDCNSRFEFTHFIESAPGFIQPTSALVGKQTSVERRRRSSLGNYTCLLSTLVTSALPPITDMPSPMSAFAVFTSGVGPKADVIRKPG